MNFKFDTPLHTTAQLIGFIPLILSFFVFRYNNRNKMIGFKAVSDLVSALHFFLLGEYTGGIINLINTARGFVFMNRVKFNSFLVPTVFCIFTAVCSLMGGEGVKSILPAAGSCLAIAGFWSNKPENIRKFNIPAVSLWLVYGIIAGSLSTVVYNIISITSIVLTERKQRL